MEAVDMHTEWVHEIFFLDAPEARGLIVAYYLSCVDIALVMIVSCFEISGFTFLIISSKTRLSCCKTKA